jgi:hypothetical protein
MRTQLAHRLIPLCLALCGLLAKNQAAAQDLLGSTRTQIQAKFGHSMFAPRLGDEDETEEFHVGAWQYIIGYRADKSDPKNNDKMKAICVLKKHDFGSAQNIEAGDLRLSLMEAQNSPTWKPFDPLPYEDKPKPGEKYRDFETLHTRDGGVLTAKGQTTRRRQRLFTYTLDWHGNPMSAPAAWFFDLPPDALKSLFQDFKGGAEDKLKVIPEPDEKYRSLLKAKGK